MGEIPRIKTPVRLAGSAGPCIRDSEDRCVCGPSVAYINATEAALVELSKHLRNNRDAVVNLERLGLWREPK